MIRRVSGEFAVLAIFLFAGVLGRLLLAAACRGAAQAPSQSVDAVVDAVDRDRRAHSRSRESASRRADDDRSRSGAEPRAAESDPEPRESGPRTAPTESALDAARPGDPLQVPAGDRFVWSRPLGLGAKAYDALLQDGRAASGTLREPEFDAANRLAALNRRMKSPLAERVFSVAWFEGDGDGDIVVGSDRGDITRPAAMLCAGLRKSRGADGPPPADVFARFLARLTRYRADREQLKARAWTALERAAAGADLRSPQLGNVSALLVMDGVARVFDRHSDPELARRIEEWDALHHRVLSDVEHALRSQR